ncbi:MAG: toll/interleukin-1 receptor domain-containing protein, partial [Pseudonocardiaceae bacterium]
MTSAQRLTRYHAFISYSHAVDERLGPALRDALHRFARRWNRRRALYVFCDRRSLSANEDLWSTIESALTASGCFILLASPESAKSYWVRREVETWQRIEPRRPLHIGLTDGEIVWDAHAEDFDWSRTTALPDSLCGWFGKEPLWVNLTKVRNEEDLSLKNPDFLDSVAELAATLHDKPKDELVGEDVRQHKLAMRLLRVGLSALSVLTVLAIVFAIIAYIQLGIAREQQQTAISRAVAAESVTLRPKSPGKSMLAAVAAWRLAPTTEARNALLEAQVQHFSGQLIG